MKKIDAAVHEAYAAHAIMTNMGFEPSEVFVGVIAVANSAVAPGHLHVVVELRRDELSFKLVLEPVNEQEAKAFPAVWQRFAEKTKPQLPPAELDRIVHGTQVWKRRADLLLALARKGFELRPGVMAN